MSLTIADYEEVLADHRRLVRELDVLLNGEAGAAKQASLRDIVSQARAGHTSDNFPKFYAVIKCSQCGFLKDTIDALGCPEECGRRPLNTNEQSK